MNRTNKLNNMDLEINKEKFQEVFSKNGYTMATTNPHDGYLHLYGIGEYSIKMTLSEWSEFSIFLNKALNIF